MKIAGFYLLGGAAIGFLLLASGVATVGPCTGELGAACLIAVVFGTPAGVVLLAISGIQYRLRRSKDSESAQTNLR